MAAPPAHDDSFAASLRGFGPAGIFALLLIILSGNVFVGNMVALPVGAALALVWVSWSRTPWREVGFIRPKSWVVTITAGIVFGSAFKLLMKAIVMPLLGADPVNQSFHFLAGNQAMLPAAVWAMFVAGFGEETVFRGYLFERAGKLFGAGAGAKTATVLLTSAWFGAAHYAGQGVPGVEQSAIFGLVLGSIFAVTGGIWLLMIAHTAFDLTALALIYWNLETAVAHSIFR